MTEFLIGTLRLHFEDEDEEASYKAKIVRAILTKDSLVMEYSGHDSHEGLYTGVCNLSIQGEQARGSASFKSVKGEQQADLEGCLEKDGSGYLLSGTWKDHGDSAPYEMEIELGPG